MATLIERLSTDEGQRKFAEYTSEFHDTYTQFFTKALGDPLAAFEAISSMPMGAEEEVSAAIAGFEVGMPAFAAVVCYVLTQSKIAHDVSLKWGFFSSPQKRRLSKINKTLFETSGAWLGELYGDAMGSAITQFLDRFHEQMQRGR